MGPMGPQGGPRGPYFPPLLALRGSPEGQVTLVEQPQACAHARLCRCNFSAPDINAPDISAPDINSTRVILPDINAPDINGLTSMHK